VPWNSASQQDGLDPYWEGIPNHPEAMALICAGRQIGSLDLETGDFTYRNPISGKWEGKGEPPIKRPVLNFGVAAERVGASPQITRSGKEVDRSTILSEIRRPLVPHPLRTVESYALPVVACIIIAAGLFIVVMIVRRYQWSRANGK